ncbi:MAG TPA: PqiC family protein [Casimicrobiaceae bacterium]|nr:PqiC family protein [Casimicrobiaceae bacterium]
MMRRLAAFALACTLAAFAASCSSPPARFYTLSPVASPGATPSKLSVLVGPVSVPSAIERPQIVVTTGANQVSIDDFNRWDAPVQDNIARVVAENLVTILGTPRVTLFQSSLGAEAEYRVQIEVRNFESAPGKYASLDAVWTVRRIKDAKLETGRSSVREATADGSYEALAAAHSRAVARLSQDIADAIRVLAGAAPGR